MAQHNMYAVPVSACPALWCLVIVQLAILTASYRTAAVPYIGAFCRQRLWIINSLTFGSGKDEPQEQALGARLGFAEPKVPKLSKIVERRTENTQKTSSVILQTVAR